MQYIRNTKNMTLTIEPYDEAKWWVDSSYAVHPDMKSYAGICMTLGKGATYTTHANKNSILKSQRKQNWWMWMMQWSKYCGQAHVMLTQMNVREGILTFSEKGNEVTLIESKQLHDRKPLCL